MRVGFTGTREGMTAEQENKVAYLVGRLLPDEAHHGDCLGADAQFHSVARLCSGAKVVSHPPDTNALRAFCVATHAREPRPYLERNRAIVDETDVLIAAPKQMWEPEDFKKGGGTWATVRYARKQGKNIYVVTPDGRILNGRTMLAVAQP